MGRPVLVLPILHPSAIIRGKFAYRDAQVEVLKRARAYLRGEWTPPTPDLTHTPVPATLFPTLTSLMEWRHGPLTQGVVVDIETAGPYLVCVGLLRLADRHALVVPFRTQGGGQYWRADQLPWVVDWLWEVLANPEVPKVFHNGVSFDIPYLEEVGFEVDGPLRDTIVMQHTNNPEQPKKLEWCAVTFCGYQPWKHLGGPDDETPEAEDK